MFNFLNISLTDILFKCSCSKMCYLSAAQQHLEKTCSKVSHPFPQRCGLEQCEWMYVWACACFFALPLVSWAARCALCGGALYRLMLEYLLVEKDEEMSNQKPTNHRSLQSFPTESQTDHSDIIYCKVKIDDSPLFTCVVALPFVQWQDGSGWCEKGESTGLKQRKPEKHEKLTLDIKHLSQLSHLFKK